MSRKAPNIPIPDVMPVEKAGIIKETRKYKVITPLYGGGEEPGKVDSITVVRATEVRGHLRFWWRATRGGAFNGDLAQMRHREEEIWGSSGEQGKPGPSKVIITLTKRVVGEPFQAKNRHGQNIDNIGNPNSVDGYVAFPLREAQNPQLPINIVFDLKIEYPKLIRDNLDITKDIDAALWAWETFGGIGARTRRGFGALHCIEKNGEAKQPAGMDKIRASVIEGLNKYVVSHGHWPSGVPHLNRSNDQLPQSFKIVLNNNAASEISAWRFLIEQYRRFRQNRTGNFGRSKWPEPDQIRRLTKQFIHPRHTPHHPVKKFPRGKFGLPIIFEFKQGDVHAGDPERTTLQGKMHDRLASPLILRPIACADGAVGLAAILEWGPVNAHDEPYAPPGGLLLKSDIGDFPVSSSLAPAEALDIPPLQGEPDVLQAFLDFLP